MLNKYEKVRPLKLVPNGFSEVFEIRDIATEKHYALKVIKGINTPLYNVIFEREVGALNKLRTCNNIVRLEFFDIYDDGQYGECGRIFMEYIDGQTLDEIDVVELDTSVKYQIIRQLINAVQVAHENNIIHRDINPRNIIITQDNKVKLIDFGISKIKDMVNTDTVFQFATNRYASPEVHTHSENATEQSDIFSLGAVFYYIFTGEEPPLPDIFEDKLSKIGGIDIELKKIIIKMIKLSPEDRYKNIFDVKKSLLKLLTRFNKTDRTYIFAITVGKIDHMKNLSLVPRDTSYEDILEDNIYNDFLESFITVENENTEQEQYFIYGAHYYFLCFYDDKSQVFYIDKVWKLEPFKREEIKKRALFLNGEVKFILSSRGIPSNNNFELTIAVKDFKKDYISSSNVNNEYTKNFYAWHKLLEIMEEVYKNNIIKIKYLSYKKEENYYLFSIEEHSYYVLDEMHNDELTFIYERKNGSKSKPVEIGNFESVYIEDNKFFLKVSITNKNLNTKLPESGQICEDYIKNLTLINRERKALNSFNNEDYASSSNLKSIFSGIELPSSFNAPQEIVYFNTNLDPAQKRAVTKALNSQDICLIQGPPGTGKTNVIIEIIRQIVETNKRGNIFRKKILLVSQANPAVDKMLEDLDNASDENSKVIRIGRDENLTEMVRKKYAVEYAQSRWVDTIIENSNKFAEKILFSLGIDKEEFNKYCEAKIESEASSKGKNSIDYLKVISFVNSFEEKYKTTLDKKEFKALIIQKDWVNRITGRTDIQQHFVKNATVVSGTCTGVVSNHTINNMVFDYVIIDEAAKATFPELVISINKGKRIIMVGDHKQLPPVLDEELIRASRKKFIESNLDFNTLYNSIFMKLFDHVPAENRHVLNTQYRMHPAIGTMISQLFYNNQISNGVPIEDRIHTIEQYKGLAIIWIDTSRCKDRFEEPVSTTYYNLLEASIVKEQLKIINQSIEGYKFSVGIITSYGGQKNLIRKEIQSLNCNNIKDEIIVNSVDAFQGGQKDIIIYSTVRSSDKHHRIGYLKSEERLNVAFSRAKRLLIVIGDAKFLINAYAENNKFPEIIKYIKSNSEFCKIVDYSAINYHHRGA